MNMLSVYSIPNKQMLRVLVNDVVISLDSGPDTGVPFTFRPKIDCETRPLIRDLVMNKVIKWCGEWYTFTSEYFLRSH